jgi:hypothetical protein
MGGTHLPSPVALQWPSQAPISAAPGTHLNSAAHPPTLPIPILPAQYSKFAFANWTSSHASS